MTNCIQKLLHVSMPQCTIIMIMITNTTTTTIIRQFFCYTKATCQSICSPSARTVENVKAYRYQVGNTVEVTCSVTGI